MKEIFAAVMLLLLSAAPGDNKKAEDMFNQAVKAMDSLQDCVVSFQLYSSSGKGNYISAYEDAKYIRNPALFYQRRTKVEASYKEQGGAGFQEIY